MSVINILSKNVRSSVFSLAWSAASHANLLNHKKVLDKDKVQLPQESFRTAPT